MIKEAYPIKDSPSGLEQYAGSPIRVVDGKAEAARWLVNGLHVFDENERDNAIRRYLLENEKESEVKQLKPLDVSKSEGVKYETVDEAILHLESNIKPPAERIKELEARILELEKRQQKNV